MDVAPETTAAREVALAYRALAKAQGMMAEAYRLMSPRLAGKAHLLLDEAKERVREAIGGQVWLDEEITP